MTSAISSSQGKRGLKYPWRPAYAAVSAPGVAAAMLLAVAAAAVAGVMLSRGPRWNAAERRGDPFCIGVGRNAPDDGFFRSNDGSGPSADPAAQGIDDE